MMVQVSGDRRTAMRWLIAFVLFAALVVALIMTTASSPSGAVQAQSSTTVSFQNGVSPSASYAGTIDTHLSQNSPTNNYAGATTLLVDGDDPNGTNNDKNTLIKWDISSIPSGATIQSASITVQVVDPSTQTFEVYALNRAWAESEATWVRATVAQNWASAGANGSTDRGTTVLGSITGSANGAYTISLNASGVAKLQSWVNSPSSNYGIILLDSANTNGLDLASSENATLAQRPKLSVTYTTGTGPTATRTSTGVQPTPTRTPTSSGTTRFAVIGDYGKDTPAELDVANMVKSWNPAFIITTGDNNYEDGAQSTIDANIGKYYHQFIGNYTGGYGAGAASNNFYPSLGNHDWVTSGATPYLNYFTLPGNERYYDFVRGPVHFFAVDSDSHEPSGISSTSTQGAWLQSRLAASTAPFKLVFFHHPPYSSGSHGNTTALQWPFQAWGADIVVTGHDHTYERLLVGGFPYIVNGLGGKSIYSFGTPKSGSQVRYNGDYGAMQVDASNTSMTLRFINRSGTVIDTYTITP